MYVYRLLNNKTGAPVKPGDIVSDAKGTSYTLVGFTPPRQPHSQGRVHVATLRMGNIVDYFPSVIDCHIETTKTSRQTFVISLHNSSDQPLETMTVTVTDDTHLKQSIIEFINTIDLFRDGDSITIATPPWSDNA